VKGFEILNENYLPMRGKYINWINIEKNFILKTKSDKYGYNNFSFIKYEKEKKKLYLKYNNVECNILIGSFLNGNIGRIIGKTTNKFKYEIGTTLKDYNRDLTIIDREYKNVKQKKDKTYEINYKIYKYKCNKCGNIAYLREDHVNNGIGCACCSNKTAILGINTMWDTDRWMCGLGVSEEDAKKYTKSSGKKIKIKCPDCGKEKIMTPNKIYGKKSISCSCGDGFYYPEKVMFNILKQLNIDFETQYSPDYIKPKKSDFYLPYYNLIVEMDGELGHEGGRVHSKSAKTIEECVCIDKWKDEQHSKHGINTVRIKSLVSDINYIKENILNSELNNLFNLSVIDWLKCESFALKNIVKEVCNYWNNKEESETTTTLSEVFGMSRQTILMYLKKGTLLNWCKYDERVEKSKNGIRAGKSKSKKVEVFKDEVNVGIYNSVSDLCIDFLVNKNIKLSVANISAVCLGKRKSHKGFTFKYVE